MVGWSSPDLPRPKRLLRACVRGVVDLAHHQLWESAAGFFAVEQIWTPDHHRSDKTCIRNMGILFWSSTTAGSTYLGDTARYPRWREWCSRATCSVSLWRASAYLFSERNFASALWWIFVIKHWQNCTTCCDTRAKRYPPRRVFGIGLVNY